MTDTCERCGNGLHLFECGDPNVPGGWYPAPGEHDVWECLDRRAAWGACGHEHERKGGAR